MLYFLLSSKSLTSCSPSTSCVVSDVELSFWVSYVSLDVLIDVVSVYWATLAAGSVVSRYKLEEVDKDSVLLWGSS